MRLSFTRCIACGGLLLPLLAPVAIAQDVEWEERTRYYEDDAWYDISEWFDGNDYNPTDETIGRIDDETYQGHRDTGADQDTDWYYGYDNRSANDDWFYDYYDTGDGYFRDNQQTGTYDYASWYLDYDDDGAYDAYVNLLDNDGDGMYEVSRLYTFNDQDQAQSESDRQNRQKSQQVASGTVRSSKAHQLEGKIVSSKKVSVRDTKHRVVAIERKDGKRANVDLGPVSELRDLNLKKGKRISAQGPLAKVGDKTVILAQTLTVGDNERQISRNPRKYQGEIAGLRKATVRGREHQMAILSGTDHDGKLLVDLGPAGRFDADLEQGDQVTVEGAPIKVQDKRIVIARSIKHDGQTVQIDRRDRGSDRTAETASRNGRQGQQRRTSDRQD